MGFEIGEGGVHVWGETCYTGYAEEILDVFIILVGHVIDLMILKFEIEIEIQTVSIHPKVQRICTREHKLLTCIRFSTFIFALKKWVRSYWSLLVCFTSREYQLLSQNWKYYIRYRKLIDF